MIKFITTSAIILALLLGWLLVQHITRQFSKQHPELGRHREEGGGCGTSCGCSGNKKSQCKKGNNF